MKLYRTMIIGAALAAVAVISTACKAEPPYQRSAIVYAAASPAPDDQLPPARHCAVEARFAYEATMLAGRQAGVTPEARLDQIASAEGLAVYQRCRARLGYRNAWLE